jgi:cytochrome oxidase Cu insertion factor (SCO1/SenC/PrrC family)
MSIGKGISRKKLFAVAVLVLLGAFVVSTLRRYPPSFLTRHFRGLRTPSIDTGMTAPNFTLPLLSGDTVSLDQYKGRPVLLKFWSIY